MTTQVSLSLAPADLVSVVFTVSVPETGIKNLPIRLAGDLLQLGNTFGDLRGGLSTLAARMPLLSPLSDGRYTITLSLPAGADIRYKYTLGDGLWNAEHASGWDIRAPAIGGPGRAGRVPGPGHRFHLAGRHFVTDPVRTERAGGHPGR